MSKPTIALLAVIGVIVLLRAFWNIPISYNLRSLAVRKTTTIASALGIGLVVFVLASSQMLSRGIKKTMGSSGSADKAFVLRKGADAELSSAIDVSQIGLVLAAPGVKRDQNGEPIGTGEVLLVIALEKPGTGGQVSNVQLRGVTDNVMKVRPEVRLVAGRPAKPGTDEVIIGQRLRGQFKGLDIGGHFEIKKNRSVEVVGVFDAGGSSFESEIWADADSARTAFGREGLVQSITATLESPSKLDEFKEAIERDKQLNMQVLREVDYFEKQSEGTAQLVNVLGGAIVFFFSLGAMVGAMITMYGAVSNRKREVGTLRALGFSRPAILLSFLSEALMLALFGGMLGALASLAMGAVKLRMMNMNTWSEVVFSFDPAPSIVLMSILGGGLMGILGGMLPAIRAARTSPVAAMRDL
jgi:putative ABC transport system permease protein